MVAGAPSDLGSVKTSRKSSALFRARSDALIRGKYAGHRIAFHRWTVRKFSLLKNAYRRRNYVCGTRARNRCAREMKREFGVQSRTMRRGRAVFSVPAIADFFNFFADVGLRFS